VNLLQALCHFVERNEFDLSEPSCGNSQLLCDFHRGFSLREFVCERPTDTQALPIFVVHRHSFFFRGYDEALLRHQYFLITDFLIRDFALSGCHPCSTAFRSRFCASAFAGVVDFALTPFGVLTLTLDLLTFRIDTGMLKR
jgi:hypothetical protein